MKFGVSELGSVRFAFLNCLDSLLWASMSAKIQPRDTALNVRLAEVMLSHSLSLDR